MTDVTPELLARLREAAEGATPGPWQWQPPSDEPWPQEDESLVTESGKVVLSGWGYDASGTSASDEDRAHIAAASPDVVAALVAEVERLRGVAGFAVIQRAADEAIARRLDEFLAADDEFEAWIGRAMIGEEQGWGA